MSTITPVQDMPVQLLQQATTNPYQQFPSVGSAPAMPAATVAKITTAICKVMSEVGVVEKTGRNEFFNYAFVRVQDVLQALTPLMAKHGLAVLQTEIKRELDQDGGKAMAITYEFMLCHVSGEVWPRPLHWTGTAICRNRNGSWDDKASNKCAVAARKYMLLSLFQVPTSDIDDADRGENDGGDIKTARDDARQDGIAASQRQWEASQAIYDALRSELSTKENSGLTPSELRAWAIDNNERINTMVREHYDAFRLFYSGVNERVKAKHQSPVAPPPMADQNLTDDQIADMLEKK